MVQASKLDKILLKLRIIMIEQIAMNLTPPWYMYVTWEWINDHDRLTNHNMYPRAQGWPVHLSEYPETKSRI